MDLNQLIIDATEPSTIENWEAIDKVIELVDESQEIGKLALQFLLTRSKHVDNQIAKNCFTLLMSLVQNCEDSILNSFLRGQYSNLLLDLYYKIKDESYKPTIKIMLEQAKDESQNSGLKDILQRALVEIESPREPERSLTPLGKILQSRPTSPLNFRLPDHDVRLAIAQSLSDNKPTPILERVRANLIPLFTVKAIYRFVPKEFGELGFEKGDTLQVLDTKFDPWWNGELNGKMGFFPSNFVKKRKGTESVRSSGHSWLSNGDLENGLDGVAQLELEISASSGLIEHLTSSMDRIIQISQPLSEKELNCLTRDYDKAQASRAGIVKLIEHYRTQLENLVGLNEKLLKARTSHDWISENLSPRNN